MATRPPSQESIAETEASALPSLEGLALGNAAVDGAGRLLLARCDACGRMLLESAHAAHVKRCGGRLLSWPHHDWQRPL